MRRLAPLLLVFLIIAQPLVAAETVRVIGVQTLYVPGVYFAPNGTMIGLPSVLRVEGLYPGSGRVYFSTQPLTEVDTQAAARIAALIASIYAGADPLSVDWLVSLTSESPVVGGPSASAATALAMYAVLTGRRIPENVSLTGMIGVDGSIGPVGGIPEKLRAMARVGVKTFFIPSGEEISYEIRRVVEKHGGMVIERVEKVPVNVTALGEELGVRVVPVASFAQLIEEVFGVKPPRVKLTLPSELRDYLMRVALRYMSEAEGNASKAESLYQQLQKSLGGGLDQWVESRLNQSRELLDEARRALQQHAYYVAASRAFAAAIQARQALEVLKLVQLHVEEGVGVLPAARQILDELLNDTESILESVNRTLTALTESRDVNALQVAVGVFERVRLAADAVERSRVLYKNRDVIGALSEAVYAYYRARSAEDWAQTYNLLGRGPAYDTERLRETLSTFTGFAEMLVTYLEKLGVSNEYLAAAQGALNELYAAAEKGLPYELRLPIAIDAITYATLAVHAEYNTAARLYNASRETALYAYAVIASRGVKPILAASYVEAGDETHEPLAKLSYYTRASTILLVLYTLLATGRAPPAIESGEAPETPCACTGTPSTSTVVTSVQGGTVTISKIFTVTKTVTETKTVYTIARLENPETRAMIEALTAGLILGVAAGIIVSIARGRR
ncbi:S16 family serine protease [Pyrolobus fumarii]|uniref:S16 family serine protease n=1 Tax=Pyrolobus fumarii TaxID=54252 RepID=UPI001FCB8016|nr:S16 family serine protease [Pyrolobus fumarii]